MKKFLKHANRGLLLGAFLIIALVIYIVIDYTRFSGEKDTIRSSIESYMDSFFKNLENSDYDSLSTLIDESWTGKAVMSDYFFYDKTDMEAEVGTVTDSMDKNSKAEYDVSDVTYRITGCSIKKAGPNIAYVSLNYSATLNNYPSMELILPFREFGSYGIDDTSEGSLTKYKCIYDGEYTLYMYKDSGTWKFSQSNGYDSLNSMTEIQEVKQ